MLFLSLFFSAAVETAVGCAVFGGLPLFFLGGFAIAVAAAALSAVGGIADSGAVAAVFAESGAVAAGFVAFGGLPLFFLISGAMTGTS